MKYVVVALAAAVLGAAQVQDRSKPRKAKPAAVRTLTGCLDQRGETYVLAGDRELRRLVTLRGEGFSDDNFARYLGHRVRVQGRLGAGDDAEFRVREIATISETCKPDER